MPELSTRHIHHNLTTGILVLLYVLVLGSALKFAVTKWKIPGLTELVNYVF